MKELKDSIITAYEQYRGTGKFFVLFLVAILIIYLLNERNEETGKRFNPGLFLLFIPLGIAYGFTKLYLYCKKKKYNRIYSVMVAIMILLVFVLSGKRVVSAEFYAPAQNDLHINDEYVEIFDSILNDSEDAVCVLGGSDILPYFRAYSSRLIPLYEYPLNNEPMESKYQYVYDQLNCSTPDENRIVKVIKDEKVEYFVYDSGKNYFNLPLEEYGLTHFKDIGEWKIYKCEEKE